MSNLLTQNDEARPDMDDLLQDYFNSEMPKQWPAFKAPKAKPTTMWSRYSGRLALAASVALLVAGYLMLGGFFPHSNVGNGIKEETGRIGKGYDKSPKMVLPMPEEE